MSCYYLYLMNNTITINLDEWTTQTKLAPLIKMKENTLIQQIKRAKEGKSKTSIEFWEIPELNITLVKKP
jgi:hypothetical protein